MASLQNEALARTSGHRCAPCAGNEPRRDDRDQSVGYFLFDYKDDGRMYPGSVELVCIADQGGGQIRVVIQIPAMPSYIERMLLDKLEKKLVDEFGQPAATLC